jgi:proteic killer suppression protein
MLEILVTEEFAKRFKELPPAVQKKAEKQERLFRQNPFHPSLHTEKLEPKRRQVWSFRINRRHRIIFRFMEGSRVVFLTVGPHEWIYRIRS